MDTGRLVEIVGAFLLGGGVVAVGYELSRTGAGADEIAVAPEEQTADRGPNSADGDGSPPAEADDATPEYLRPTDKGTYDAFPSFYRTEAELDAAAEAKYPKHGLVTTVAAVLREQADLDAKMLGILRSGTRIRLDAEVTYGGSCKKGWNRVFPRGWLCRDAGVLVKDQPPDEGMLTTPPPEVDKVLPYEYWRVKDEMTPFFHRLPTYTEQDRADSAGRAWFDEHGRKPMPTRYSDRPSAVPAVVKEYQNAGYWITRAGEEVKLKRRFVRTIRGTYARKYQLQQREITNYRGVLVTSANPLPLHFVRRELPLLKREQPDSDVLIPTEHVPERRGVHPFEKIIHIGAKKYFVDDEGLLMRDYAVSRVAALDRPAGIDADEHWIHVDLSEQSLVAYIGDRPVFATLVSTGREPGMTPTGVFRIQSKHIATSMRDQPPEEEAYSIEDVPWTQYFSNNIALHGAFWHGGFGLVRSHGCVNLSPADARWLFGFSHPALPTGWHSVMPGVGDNGQGSAVVVTP